MLQVAMLWGMYSLFMLIVESIKHGSRMASTVPCRVTVTQVDRKSKNKKTDICQYTLSGSYDGGRISDSIQELVAAEKEGPFAYGQTYDMRVNPKNGHCYNPAAGTEKVKNHAITLGVSVLLCVLCILILNAM